MRSLFSRTSFATLFCLLAAVSPALPWSFGYSNFSVNYDGTLGYDYDRWFSGYADWQGAAISITGGAGFFLLLATGGLKPAPWWRTLGVGLVGVLVLVFVMTYSTHHWNHFPVREMGGLLAIAASTGLLLTVALDLRAILDAKYNQPTLPPQSPSA